MNDLRFVPFDTGYVTNQSVTLGDNPRVTDDDLDRLDRPSADNSEMVAYWDLVDTIVAGTDAMRNAGKKYLPQMTEETTKDYAKRLASAKFTNIYRDILEGLASKPFEMPITLADDDETTIPQQIEEFIKDVDGAGSNISVFSVDTFFDGINRAIDWIFIDYPSVSSDRPMSIAEEKAAGIRPYWSHVLARNVLEVRSRIVNGQEALTYIRILEPANNGEPERVRIMYRDENGAAFELYKLVSTKNRGKSKRFEFERSGPISIGVIPMVPFVTGRRKGRRWSFYPAMRDAADLQVEVYQAESGLKNMTNLTCFPMLAASGVNPPKKADGTVIKMAVGPGAVLFAPPSGANASGGSYDWLTFDTGSLDFIAKQIDTMITQLRELGRQPLTAQSGNLTVITTMVAAKKANSAVQSWAFGLADALANALIITGLWFGITKEKYDPSVVVFTDFDVTGQAEDLNTLNTARGKKDLSQRTYWSELRRRNVLSSDFNPDAEEKALLDETPGDDFPEDDIETDPLTGKPVIDPETGHPKRKAPVVPVVIADPVG